MVVFGAKKTLVPGNLMSNLMVDCLVAVFEAKKSLVTGNLIVV